MLLLRSHYEKVRTANAAFLLASMSLLTDQCFLVIAHSQERG